MTPDATRGTPHEARSRPELARQLLARVDRIESRLGDISLAAEVQLLKRELARGHDVLNSCREDNNYLSVVTLVEGALANLTWKGYTPAVLESLRRAFSAGTCEGSFTFEDYDAVRRHFAGAGIATGPRIDLTSLDGEVEGEDGPQA
jgi:hypothetical protein